MALKDRIMSTMLELVKIPGISGTESEVLISNKVFNELMSIQYFVENPDNLVIEDIKGDIYNRKYVAALFESSVKTNRTIIITGHTDVVGVDEFGHLKDYAFDPITFTKRVKELKLDEDSLKDLDSGEWLFGRGVADMKYGIALGIELIRELSLRDDFVGNLLFLAVPGEESNSEGMLGAVSYLLRLKEKRGLDYICLLLPEPYLPSVQGNDRRNIHIGACGKIMPLFFFVGKETHVSDAFGGFNPNLLASEVNHLMEFNTEFCEAARGRITPPPLCLKQTDLKELYSVQTPIYAASYYNLITLDLKGDEIISKLKAIGLKAFENALKIYDSNKLKYEILLNKRSEHQIIKPNVLTFSELYGIVLEQYPGFEQDLKHEVDLWRECALDNQKIAINIIKYTYEKYPNKEPVIIIGFTPPYYPDRYPDLNTDKNISFMDSIDNLIQYSKALFDEELIKENYFMGICDLSYTGMQDTKTLENISANMPGLGLNYSLPIEELSKLDITGVVLGPHGKDLHKYTERINIPFSFDVLPKLYEYIIYDLFKK